LRRPSPAVGQQDDLQSVPELAVGGRAELGLQGVAFAIGELDVDHGCFLPPVRELLLVIQTRQD
jgi:hypothetical protein